MNAVLVGLAADLSLPAELVGRLIEVADDATARELAHRSGLTPAQVTALVASFPGTAVPPARWLADLGQWTVRPPRG